MKRDKNMPGQWNVKFESETNLPSGNKNDNTLAGTLQAEKKTNKT